MDNPIDVIARDPNVSGEFRKAIGRVRYRYLDDDGVDCHGGLWANGVDPKAWPTEEDAARLLGAHEGCCGATVFELYNDQTGRWETYIG